MAADWPKRLASGAIAMETGCAGCRLAGFLATAILIQITELAFHVWILYFLYSSGYIIWFAACTSILILSALGTQLISYQLRRKENPDRKLSASFVISHVMLLGLFWRYQRLARCCHLPVTRSEIWQCFVVNVFQAFTLSFPMLFIAVYLIMVRDLNAISLSDSWLLMAGAASSVIAIIRTLVAYKKRRHICCVIGAVKPSGGLVWKIPWRLGEVTARTLSAAIFAAVHGYWILLVCCLHWVTVTLILVIDHMKVKNYKAKALHILFLSSYIHAFVGFNVASGRSRLVTILYHVLFCAESFTLTTLWLLYESRKELRVPVSAAIACCQISALVFAIGYYNFLLKKPDVVGNDNDVIFFQCLACRTSQKATKRFTYRANHAPEVISRHCVARPVTSEVANHDNIDRHCNGNDVIVTSHDLPVRHIKRLHNNCARSACSSCTCAQEGGDALNQSGMVNGDPDLSWDNYDINNYSDTTDCCSEIQRSSAVQSNLDTSNTRVTSGSSSKQNDPGYSSGISSSSSKPTGGNPDQTQIQNKGTPRKRIPLFPNTCDGYWSDEGSSTIASISTLVCVINTDKRQRHDVMTTRDSLGSSVGYSTSTTYTSEQRYERTTDVRLPVTQFYDGRHRECERNSSGYDPNTSAEYQIQNERP